MSVFSPFVFDREMYELEHLLGVASQSAVGGDDMTASNP
jgi:hypothetical protein